jgi:ribosomal protein S18 acetylase RimI-like enzyme
MKEIVYTDVGEQDLDAIGPLWWKLRRHHQDRAPEYFAGDFARMPFELRKKILLEKAAKGAIYIDLARESDTRTIIGYCVSSVTEKKMGEIESIYVEEEYRRHGIGDSLMQRALNWLETQGVVRVVLGVGAGNEEVFPFYRQYGFYPRTTILEQVDKKGQRPV